MGLHSNLSHFHWRGSGFPMQSADQKLQSWVSPPSTNSISWLLLGQAPQSDQRARRRRLFHCTPRCKSPINCIGTVVMEPHAAEFKKSPSMRDMANQDFILKGSSLQNEFLC